MLYCTGTVALPEPNQAKPREKAPFLPEGEPRRTTVEFHLGPKCGGSGGAYFGPKGILVRCLIRCRSLGVKSFIRNFWKPRRYKGKYRYFTSFCYCGTVLGIAPEGGLG